MIYFDASYLVRLYFEEPGWKEVRLLRGAEPCASCLHGQAEVLAAMHRKFREGAIAAGTLAALIAQFGDDCTAGEFHWLPLDGALISKLAGDYAVLPGDCFLRAADALHLACARDHGFKTVYSNDKILLAAARHFGVRGRNVIGKR